MDVTLTPANAERTVRAHHSQVHIVTDALAILAASWGVLMALSPILQVRRMLARRSSSDVSLAYLGVLQIGFTLWVAYGISIANFAIVVPNSVAFIIGAATVLVAFRFRHPDAHPAPARVAQHEPAPRTANPRG